MGDINPDGLPNLTLEEKEKGRSAGFRMLCFMHGVVFAISSAVGFAVFSLGQKEAYTAKILTVQSGQFPRLGGGSQRCAKHHTSGPPFPSKIVLWLLERATMAARTRGLISSAQASTLHNTVQEAPPHHPLTLTLPLPRTTPSRSPCNPSPDPCFPRSPSLQLTCIGCLLQQW